MNVVLLFIFFFFQAEDGIRDLVRSRGLGDVYKRQDVLLPRSDVLHDVDHHVGQPPRCRIVAIVNRLALFQRLGDEPVSYTHLTLPTSDLV